ncbi:MAG TPA: MBL fold metallo-hydrolase [Candidatus Binatia bacterium]|jgi:glyoxylase-like metal-dependent hydrolase (beta-lactamase superfamily II)|nr:MBL fold metallo-hydrolase [Candidatus Binatia bacterium]
MDKSEITFPFPTAPELGKVVEVVPGILWVRIPLPFRLDHVNIYVIDDGDGWAVLDTGIGNDVTRAVWSDLLSGPLRGRRLTRLIVTHHHPDHIGLAGWLSEQFGLQLLTSQTSYLGCLNISLSPGALDAKPYRDFYLRHGLDAKTTGTVSTRGHEYLKMVTGLPPTFRRLVHGDELKLGGRRFLVLTGDGHAPEQVMLFCAEENLFLAADQVLAKISPNVSVWAVEPEGDPLQLYLRSLKALKSGLPADALVLPGHQLPFYGLHQRIDQLVQHHHQRCEMILEACRDHPRSAAELVPLLFHHPLDPHQTSFAFSEVLAHVNFMLEAGNLVMTESTSGVLQTMAA